MALATRALPSATIQYQSYAERPPQSKRLLERSTRLRELALGDQDRLDERPILCQSECRGWGQRRRDLRRHDCHERYSEQNLWLRFDANRIGRWPRHRQLDSDPAVDPQVHQLPREVFHVDRELHSEHVATHGKEQPIQ